WTNPAAVRQQVMLRLEEMFPGATISLDSARLRILGGISLSELRFTRRDDPEQTELLHIPSAILYHDKEKLLEGSLSIRKVELQRPRLRLVRYADGRWNLHGLAALESRSKEPLPT